MTLQSNPILSWNYFFTCCLVLYTLSTYTSHSRSHTYSLPTKEREDENEEKVKQRTAHGSDSPPKRSAPTSIERLSTV
ncbi:hypothetical protein F5Y03DRAFT_365375 [Xylaria venustula]|nr:hypothetical protein F5Y03DRAFT_365375 [Xylaria venustula]